MKTTPFFLIALCGFFLLSFIVMAQDEPDMRKLALQYYGRCLENLYTDLSGETQESFCACSADAAEHGLTKEELQALAEGRGRIDPYRLALKAFVPCIAGPLGEIEQKSCLINSKYRHFFKTQPAYEAMCLCQRQGIEDFIKEYGNDLGAYTAKRFPGYNDLVSAIRQGPEYQLELAKWATSCMNSYAYH